MKVLKAAQVRAWDEFTIQHERISSIDLMERAAANCVHWLEKANLLPCSLAIFCGKGNNGGDGLAIARMVADMGSTVDVYILETGNKGTDEFQYNLQLLHQYNRVGIHYIQQPSNFPVIEHDVVIDALFGSGLTRPPAGLAQQLIEYVNNGHHFVVSIDVPSGMSVDDSSKGNAIIRAAHTLTFQCYKPALLIPENAFYVGEVHIIDIGLHPQYELQVENYDEIIDQSLIERIYKKRNRFAHKGDFGHALLVCGSYGKIGAAVLCSKACLRTGSGLVTVCVPKCGYEILQQSVPEAMVLTDPNSSFISSSDFLAEKHDVIGIGPGLGTASETRGIFHEIFKKENGPMVLDADALNILSMEHLLYHSIRPNSILTPHPKEFERLFGKSSNDFEMIETVREQARKLKLIIVLKGHHTFIATPGGRSFFNTTGNAGMATAGSGDVLTGMITSLLGQGYTPENAAILGVYLHGRAGDMAAQTSSEEAIIASDIIEQIGNAFLSLS